MLNYHINRLLLLNNESKSVMTKYLVLILLVFFSFLTYAQGAIEKKRQLSDKVFFGGGLGLQFGTVTAVEIMPIIGYKPIDNLYFGIKGKFEYYKFRSDLKGTTIYGGSIFGMYSIFDVMLAYAEYEVLSFDKAYFNNYPVNNGERSVLQTPLVGGGVLQSLGGRSKLMLLVLWNLNTTYSSYYSNPIIRLSFLF